jgi:hypothetical protein
MLVSRRGPACGDEGGGDAAMVRTSSLCALCSPLLSIDMDKTTLSMDERIT